MRAAVAVFLAVSAVTTTVAQLRFRAGVDLVHFSVVVSD